MEEFFKNIERRWLLSAIAAKGVEVDVIVVTYNSLWSLFMLVVGGLLRTGVRCRLVFQDAGTDHQNALTLLRDLPLLIDLSNVGSLVEAQGEVAGAVFGKAERHLWFTEATNKALEEVERFEEPAPWVLLLNPDCHPLEPRWLRRWIDLLLEDEKERGRIGASGALHFRSNGLIDHAGAYGPGFHVGVGEEDRGQYDSVRDVEWATGASLLVRREALLEVGGRLPLEGDLGPTVHYGSDRVLCLKIKEAGWRVVCAPVRFRHDRGRSSE